MAAALVALPMLTPVLTVVDAIQHRQDILSDLNKLYESVFGRRPSAVKIPKLPLSDPIPHSSHSRNGPPTGLLRLPPEIRLRIYHYAFPGHRVIQPELWDNKLRARFGLLPMSSLRSPSYIRSDEDPPSTVLRMTVEDGGSSLDQVCARIPATKIGPGRLICGDAEAWVSNLTPGFLGGGRYTSLLGLSRTVYREVLHELYGQHTFSFFGPEMLNVFLDNASPEGCQHIRYVHLAVPLPSTHPGLKDAMEALGSSLTRLRLDMPSVVHLDVELLFASGEPSDPGEVWRWIKHEAFSPLQGQGIEKFVLKISVLEAVKVGKLLGSNTIVRPLRTWNHHDYIKLKEGITGC